MIVVVGVLVGAVCGVAAAALWWALGTLAGFLTPTDAQAAACGVVGVVLLGGAGLVAVVLWD